MNRVIQNFKNIFLIFYLVLKIKVIGLCILLKNNSWKIFEKW